MPARRYMFPLVVALALVAATAGARAQELEPRAYSNAPVGFNFLIAGYAFSRGGLSLDPSLPLQDAHIRIHSVVFAYARVLDLWGTSGKLDVILPCFELSGSGTFDGQLAERQVSGFGDPRFRLSVNLYGAPALSMQEFGGYHKDLVIGASVQVSAPMGQYDPSKAINLGSNRWSIKPSIGFSKALGALTVDVTASGLFYSDNDDFLDGKTLEQAPIYSVQGNLSYELGGDVWAALGTTYYFGGRTTLDGEVSDAELGNARVGALLSLPLSRRHSIKASINYGVYTRFGSTFVDLGIAWQYRWGAGY
jgi:hypothetical protein